MGGATAGALAAAGGGAPALTGGGGAATTGGGPGCVALGIGGPAGGLLWSAPHLMQKRMPGWSPCPHEEHTSDLGDSTGGALAAAGGGTVLTGGEGAAAIGGGAGCVALGSGGPAGGLLWSAPHLMQ